MAVYRHSLLSTRFFHFISRSVTSFSSSCRSRRSISLSDSFMISSTSIDRTG